MMRLLLILLALMMVLATPAFAQEHAQNSQGAAAQDNTHGASSAPAKKTIDEIRPIPPDEIVKSAEKVGGNVVKLGQGVAKQLVPVSLIAAALLILVGAAVASITKSFLKAGFGVLAGIVVLYLLVFHYDKIVGGFKGLGVGN